MDKRVHFLDVMKGIFIIVIIITHFNWQKQERLIALFPFWIDMAVPVFMLISGYVYAASMSKNNISNIYASYSFLFICKKIIRYTLPFSIAFFLELIIYKNITATYSILELILNFICGGLGPGSYYYPVMIQFIFIFPLIYFPIKRNPRKGLLFFFLFNFIYEVLQRAYGLNEGTYRLLIFRYAFLIAFGCFTFIYEGTIDRKLLVGSFFTGIAYIVLVCYTPYEPRIIIYWTRTSFIAALYIIPVFHVLIKKCGTVSCKPLEVLGKASFNIFLTQMVWYNGASSLIYDNIKSRGAQLILNIVICLTAGTIFYILESSITRYVISKIGNSRGF